MDSSRTGTKRKLDDAFSVLDDAVRSKEHLNTSESMAPPPKKPFTGRSFYSTLAKYGIKSSESEKSKSSLKSTPHLSAILSRAATRTRKAMPFQSERAKSSPLSSSLLVDYRPSSITSFLARLSTYKLATYANKPSAIDAVAAAKCGWVNDGKDRLVCGICNVSWVVAGRDGMSRDAANTLIDKQRSYLVENHKNGCPWRSRQCDSSIYRIPLQSSNIMVKTLRDNALILDPLLQGVAIRHPLTSTQLSSLQFTIASPQDSSLEQTSSEPSSTAVLTALFGWTVAPERPAKTSFSRSTSRLQSGTATPSLSGTSSAAPGTTDLSESLLLTVTAKSLAPGTSLLQCSLCQRRVGLWAFAATKDQTSSDSGVQPASSTKQRQFDLLKEHRSYCPYVVRSTVVPSLPAINSTTRTNDGSDANGAMEGWKAVLTVILRHGVAQRHQLGWQPSENTSSTTVGGDDNTLNDVQAMVQGVKNRGGKDLLRYVKGLLG
ncbi:hypothetical protein D9758_003813 [Tetrapyrgos nigripes]|uniref:Zf-C3HC-domain-containing protein n=1 Tax=Tetrapyrgos nigripes TaxID=182062 RepID=A0A8H5LS94_9AGAR|nr:hypothetical protein D9758_003813 [Tetrapyrgos nigripes]